MPCADHRSACVRLRHLPYTITLNPNLNPAWDAAKLTKASQQTPRPTSVIPKTTMAHSPTHRPWCSVLWHSSNPATLSIQALRSLPRRSDHLPLARRPDHLPLAGRPHHLPLARHPHGGLATDRMPPPFPQSNPASLTKRPGPGALCSDSQQAHAARHRHYPPPPERTHTHKQQQ